MAKEFSPKFSEDEIRQLKEKTFEIDETGTIASKDAHGDKLQVTKLRTGHYRGALVDSPYADESIEDSLEMLLESLSAFN